MKNVQRIKNEAKERRVARVRARVKGTTERPRLAVLRTLRHTSVQLIDDTEKKTIASVSDRDIKKTKEMKPVEVAREIGKLIAARAIEKNVKRAVFDRRDKKYHGRIRALAEGAREGGLEF
ncbi:MAG: 50S ribosomal protein L18 [Patescibacteria group bacterium]